MIVLRFKVQCRPDKTAAVAEAMTEVVAASRALPGVVHFDVAADVTVADVLIATEVFEDAAARERQEALPQVAKVMSLLPDSLAAPPEATLFHVSSAEAAM
jgi:quinol monooxygenase YgiN